MIASRILISPIVALLLVSILMFPSVCAQVSSSSVNSIIIVKNSYTAGYGAAGANFSVTSVNGSWIQPKVNCQTKGKTIYAAGFSVQIDGFNGKDIEIVGTGGGCEYGTTEYLAFYGFIPTTGENTFNIKIKPGDKILASMSYSSSSGNFTAYLKDVSTGKWATAGGSVSNAQRNSVEAGVISIPNSSGECCLPLIRFSKASFGMDYTSVSATCYATIAGKSLPIGSFKTVYRLEMTNVKGNEFRALPSILSEDNSSFTVTWKSSGP